LIYRPYPFSKLPFFPISAFEGIPEHAALFFEFKNLEEYRDSLDQTAYASDLNRHFLFRKLGEDLGLMESMLETDSLRKDLFLKSSLIASLQSSGPDALHYLFIVETTSATVATEYLEHFISFDSVRVQPSVFRDELVYQIKSRSGESLSISTYRNLVLVGRHSLLVEESLAQLKKMKRHSLTNVSFRKWLSKSQSPLSVYLKPSNLYMTALPFLSLSGKKQAESLLTLDIWLGGDLFFKDEGIEFKGYIKPKRGGFLNAIKRGKPGDRTDIKNALPDHIALMSWLGYKSIKSYTRNGALKSNAIFDKYFVPWLSDHMAYVMTEPYSINLDAERFLLFGVADQKKAEEYLDRLSREEGELASYNYMTFSVRQIMTGQFLGSELWPTSSFKNPFVVFIGNHLVVCQSRQALEVWIDKYLSGQMLNKDAAFLKYNQHLQSETNFWQHVQPSNIKQLMRSITGAAFQLPLKEELQVLENFHPIGFEIMNGGEVKGFLQYESITGTGNTSLLWKTRLNGNVLMEPKIVETPNLEPNEIWVQDETNFLHVLSDEGDKKWNRKLDGPLLSDIHVLDFYRIRESHYLFNTAGKIYLVDGKGRDVGSFPIRLQSPATNGVLAVDFDQNKKYQFFVGCKNGNIYGFERTGRPLRGWSPQVGVGQIGFPMIHFQREGNDYIVAFNKRERLYVFRRDGSQRLGPFRIDAPVLSTPDFDNYGPSPRIVVTDQDGMANIVTLKGNRFRLELMEGQQDDVRFAFADVVGDNRKDYLTLSGKKLSVHAYGRYGAFSERFSIDLTKEPDNIFGVDMPENGKSYVGTYSTRTNQIYMYNSKGEQFKNFPLAGSTPFSIVRLFKNNELYLVVGSGASVYAYRIR